LFLCYKKKELAFAPLVSPITQVATVGSDVIFTCDKPSNSKEPDRYIWFKKINQLNETNNLNPANSNGHGPILKLNNLTFDQSGWYLCCILYSSRSSNQTKGEDDDGQTKVSNQQEYMRNSRCSSAELKVNNLIDYDNNYGKLIPKNKIRTFVLIAMSALTVMIIFLLSFLIFVCHKKLSTFDNAQKASSNLNKV
jgi:hypothetical protein